MSGRKCHPRFWSKRCQFPHSAYPDLIIGNPLPHCFDGLVRGEMIEYFIKDHQRQFGAMRSKQQSIKLKRRNICFVFMELFVRDFLLLIFVTFFCLSSGEEESCDASKRKCFHVSALVPARSGSKGIKDKNLSVIGNETLLSRTLRIINESEQFDSIWVSTDGKAIADVATKHNANVHWRDPSTATDNASTIVAVEDFLKSHNDYDIISVIQCTSPFIRKEFLRGAVDALLKSNADCIFSVTRNHQLRWKENNEGYVSALNFDPKNRPRRQDWKGELVENGMFYFARKELILKQKILQNDRCKTFEIPKEFSLEIDTKFDLMLTRAMVKLLEEKTADITSLET